MKDPVYKLIELTGTSSTSIEDAVAKAIKRAHNTIKNLCWFQVVETRGDIAKIPLRALRNSLKTGKPISPPLSIPARKSSTTPSTNGHDRRFDGVLATMALQPSCDGCRAKQVES
jgi:flavin-binding protein dodecin